MLPKYFSTPLAWLLTLAVASFISVACATESGTEKTASKPPQKADKHKENAPEPETEVKVYTNQDLEKMFGEEEESAEAPAPPAEEPEAERKPVMEVTVEPEPGEKPAADPLALMRQEQAMAAERDRAIADAKKTVADARARVTQLEQRILALKNPYLPRPEIPDDEKAGWESMGTRERLEQSEQQLEQARADLKAAKKALADIH